MKTIQIVVSPDGQSRIETRGFAGADCRQASRFIEEALGNKVSENLTAEFHQAGAEVCQSQERAHGTG